MTAETITPMTDTEFREFNKILTKVVGADFQPDRYDYDGPALIHYTTTEMVEHGTRDDRWGWVTSESEEEVEQTLEVTTARDLIREIKRIDGEHGITCMEVSDEVARELMTMWDDLFGTGEGPLREVSVQVSHGLTRPWL